MDIVFSPPALRILLLVVLFAPLGFALLVAFTRDNSRSARTIAGMCSVLHLGLTTFLVAIAAISLTEYGGFDEGSAPFHFRPVYVPGDIGASSLLPGGGQESKTNWNLFFVGKPTAKMAVPAVQFFIGLDGINIWLVMLSSLMTYVAVMASWGFTSEKPGWYYAWMFVLQTAVTGAFLSFDVILFYVFFELTLIPSFFLIGGWGVGGSKRDAARKFFLYTFFGSLFTLVGIIGIVLTNPSADWKASETAQVQTLPTRGPITFSVNQLMINAGFWQMVHDDVVNNLGRAVEGQKKSADLSFELELAKERRDSYRNIQFWLFFALITGFVVKIPLVPFHTWLPSAYGEAPPAVTLLLSALMAKLGTLGLLRIVIPLCPVPVVQYGLPVLGLLGAIGVVYAALCAFAQKDIKLMAAFSSVSHLGLLVLGIFALNIEGLTGSVLHMVNHGLTAGALFGLVAILFNRYRTTDMTKFSGLLATHPRFAFFTIFICLAGVGLPGLNNFVSEMMLLSSLFTPWNRGIMGYGLAVAGASGIFLSAWYTFTMIRKVLFGPAKSPEFVTSPNSPKTSVDLSGRECLAFGLLSLVILALGIYPKPVLDTIKGDVSVLAQRMSLSRYKFNPTLAVEEDAKLKPTTVKMEAPAQPAPAVPAMPAR
jgi:NADH-quinone oxidoreductase subunit M